jgi:hypothetical protein
MVGDIDVDVDVSLGGGGGGIAPGECIVPAVADSASTMLRLTTAQVRRKLFTRRFPPRKKYKQLCICYKNAKPLLLTLDQVQLFLQEGA